MSSEIIYTQNRELSWLRFNERVLEEAADPRVPLLERLKFISIFVSNLDEFFMVRCGSLYDASLVDPDHKDSRSGMTPSQQLDAIYQEVHRLYPLKDEVAKSVNTALLSLQMGSMTKKQLNDHQLKWIKEYFENEVASMLSPLIIDVHHPFPHLLNKALYVFVRFKGKDNQDTFGIISVPDYLDRIIYLPEMNGSYMLLEQLILHHVDQLFPNFQIRSKSIIRITRNADINLDEKEIDEDEDYREFMKNILKKRKRLAAIRLEYYKEMDEEMLDYLCQQLNLTKEQVYCSRTALDFSYVFSMIGQAHPALTQHLLYDEFTPKGNARVQRGQPLIPQILDHDVLLFYPYQDIQIFLDLLQEASRSNDVISIKITIYRLAKNSKIVRSLIHAAENGIEVTVLMELRARFDEQHNIEAAQILEEAGCTIIYGFEREKVHSKVCQICLKSRHGIRTITQIGTGNYNEKTSHMYTDISYITANDKIGKDGMAFFQNMSIGNLDGNYNQIMVSPYKLKQKVSDLMDEQLQKGKDGYIFIKMNSLTDVELIEKMRECSQADCTVDMVLRGICCLLPEKEGYTDNVHVRSIVGRFLEHSRIYIFGKENPKIYISSADFMTRNTEKRVEVACPILDENLKKEILEYKDSLMKDNIKARVMTNDGTYRKVETVNEAYDSQDEYTKMVIKEEVPQKKSRFSNLFFWKKS